MGRVWFGEGLRGVGEWWRRGGERDEEREWV